MAESIRVSFPQTDGQTKKIMVRSELPANLVEHLPQRSSSFLSDLHDPLPVRYK